MYLQRKKRSTKVAAVLCYLSEANPTPLNTNVQQPRQLARARMHGASQSLQRFRVLGLGFRLEGFGFWARRSLRLSPAVWNLRILELSGWSFSPTTPEACVGIAHVPAVRFDRRMRKTILSRDALPAESVVHCHQP